MLNFLYGVITDGGVPDNTPGYRYTEARRTSKTQQKYLPMLIPEDPTQRASIADLIIKLMRSSSNWVAFIREKDQTNTYDIEVDAKPLPDGFTSKLFKWLDSVAVNSTKYPVSKYDDRMQRLINTLYAIVCSED